MRPRAARLVLSPSAALGALSLIVALGGCEREARRFTEPPAPKTSTPDPNPYRDNGWAVAEGKRLYTQMNCNGCHATGGGDIGPALSDARWIYGGGSQEVFTSIAHGRPNGMPSYAGRLAPTQLWQIVAYVQSMSGQLRKDVRPGRSDDIHVGQSEQARPPEPGAVASGTSR